MEEIKCINQDDVKGIAPQVLSLVKIIRDWLPTESKPAGSSGNPYGAYFWLSAVAKHWTAVERIRNPNRIRFSEWARQGRVSCREPVDHLPLMELWQGLDSLAELYRLTEISASASSAFSYEGLIPVVPNSLLDVLEKAANGLANLHLLVQSQAAYR